MGWSGSVTLRCAVELCESKQTWRTPTVVLKKSPSWLFKTTALLEFSCSAWMAWTSPSSMPKIRRHCLLTKVMAPALPSDDRGLACVGAPHDYFVVPKSIKFILLLKMLDRLSLRFFIFLLKNCFTVPASRDGNVTVYVWHKPTELAHSPLFCSCVYLCLYGPFNCISFRKFAQ